LLSLKIHANGQNKTDEKEEKKLIRLMFQKLTMIIEQLPIKDQKKVQEE
jgi:hypothetical protein